MRASACRGVEHHLDVVHRRVSRGRVRRGGQRAQVGLVVDAGQQLGRDGVAQQDAAVGPEHDRGIVDRGHHRVQLRDPGRLGGHVPEGPDAARPAPVDGVHRCAVAVEHASVIEPDGVPRRRLGREPRPLDRGGERVRVDHEPRHGRDQIGVGLDRPCLPVQPPDLAEPRVREDQPPVEVEDRDAIERGLALGLEHRALECQRLREPAGLADVAGDRRGTDDLARRVTNRRDRERDRESLTVAADALGLEVLDRLAPCEAAQDLRDLGMAIGRREARDLGPDDVVGRVAVHALGRRVPAQDRAVEGLGEDGVLGGVDNRGEEPLACALEGVGVGDHGWHRRAWKSPSVRQEPEHEHPPGRRAGAHCDKRVHLGICRGSCVGALQRTCNAGPTIGYSSR